MPSPLPTKSSLRIPSLRPLESPEPPNGSVQDVTDFIQSKSNLLVVTGAGLSTGSGIPAYRNSDGEWLRRTPIFYQDFIRCPLARRRYWARSYFGWHHVANAEPNAGHLGLAQMESDGLITRLITQNVDGLHERAGSQSVVEVHGQLGRVKCLDCQSQFERQEIQDRLETLNVNWSADVLGYNPDGDVDLDEAAYPDFKVAHCDHCRGTLKPDVVFFGESVPFGISESIQKAINDCDGVLVIGSSLVVMSGYRIAKQAHTLGKSVIAINEGRTRADDFLRFKVTGDCVGAIESLCARF